MTQRLARPFVLTLAVVIALGAIGCTGEVIGDPEVEVSRLELSANDLGALVADACTRLGAQEPCASYPNPKACDHLLVSIRGDGRTVGHCRQGAVVQLIHGIAEGIPIRCALDLEQGCVRCVDLYGGLAAGTCTQPAAPAPEPSTPQSSGGSHSSSIDPDPAKVSCKPEAVQGAFVEKLNQVLEAEGFSFSFAPDLAKLKSQSGFNAETVCGGGFGLNDTQLCDPLALVQGRCYCHTAALLGVRCRCARLLNKVLDSVCGGKPPECGQKEWTGAIFAIYAAATKWLNAVKVGLSSLTGSSSIQGASGPDDVVCLGSPLLLDLANDGVELSPVSAGVSFDLTGAGAQRTAWVRGADDALLALDRNGNGAIDGGAELFGEGTRLGQGRKAADGFEALAALDRPELGGNGNGLVDPADFLFDQLVLWRDADHDGRSAPGELVSLAREGIVGLELRGISSGTVVDRHGNDLSLRARYLRAEGSGLLVDALFVTTDR